MLDSAACKVNYKHILLEYFLATALTHIYTEKAVDIETLDIAEISPTMLHRIARQKGAEIYAIWMVGADERKQVPLNNLSAYAMKQAKHIHVKEVQQQ